MKEQKKNNEKGKITFSMRYQIMALCLSSVLLMLAIISVQVIPSVTKIVTQDKKNYMNDFITSHSGNITNKVEDIKTTINNIEYTCAMIDNSNMNGDFFAEMNTVLRNFASQNQLDSQSVYIVGTNKKVMAALSDSYLGGMIDDESYNVAFNSDKEIEVQTIADETTGTVRLLFTKKIKSGDQVVAILFYYVSNEVIQNAVVDFTLTGIDEPKVYVIDRDGILIANSNTSAIGIKTGNTVLLEMLERKEDGESISAEAGYGKYEYEGDEVGVSYIYLPETEWTLAIATLDKIVYSSVDDVKRRYIISSTISFVLAAVVIFFFSIYFSKPIEMMKDMISKAGNLDFTLDREEKRFKRISKRKDEIGAMAQSIASMLGIVSEKLADVSESSNHINKAAADLQKISNEISDMAGDTSAITEELSAGMEETTASTEAIASDVSDLKENVRGIKDEIAATTQTTSDIIVRARDVMEQSLQAEQNTRKLFAEIKQKGDAAIEQSNAVKQIDKFAQVIQDIAGQTSLLALNASIEAARAGDAGRGFAVVAEQIGSLAQQSSDTVGKITEMVAEVNKAVANIIECLEMSQEFVETNVYADYDKVQKILTGYENDTHGLHETMNRIDSNATDLAKTMDGITEAIQAINLTLQEAAIGVSDIAQRNSSIGGLTADSNQMVMETECIAAELKQNIGIFKL